MKKVLIAIIFNIISFNCLQAQDVTAGREIDTNDVLIGDWINVSLYVKSKPPVDVVWPAIPDSLGELEVISRSKIDTQMVEGSRILKGVITVTAFDSGRYEFPQVTFMYKREGFDELFSASTDPIDLNFTAVKVDTTKPIRDIKGPMEVEFSILDYLWEIIIAFAVIGLGVFLWFFFKNRKKEKPEALDYDPKIPPHILALEALRQLNEEKLWQQDKVKLYHSRLTDIVRVYIFRRFGIDAPEMTTAETVQNLSRLVAAEQIEKIRVMLELADLVKFAKVKPLPNENSLSYDSAIEFVSATIPAEKEKEENNGGGENV